MRFPLQITFADFPPSPALSQEVTERAEKLDRFHPRIKSCRVAIGAAGKRHTKGRLYSIRIELRIPGRDIAVSRSPAADHSHADIHKAIHDAFDAAERKLEDIVRRRRNGARVAKLV